MLVRQGATSTIWPMDTPYILVTIQRRHCDSLGITLCGMNDVRKQLVESRHWAKLGPMKHVARPRELDPFSRGIAPPRQRVIEHRLWSSPHVSSLCSLFVVAVCLAICYHGNFVDLEKPIIRHTIKMLVKSGKRTS